MALFLVSTCSACAFTSLAASQIVGILREVMNMSSPEEMDRNRCAACKAKQDGTVHTERVYDYTHCRRHLKAHLLYQQIWNYRKYGIIAKMVTIFRILKGSSSSRIKDFDFSLSSSPKFLDLNSLDLKERNGRATKSVIVLLLENLRQKNM